MDAIYTEVSKELKKLSEKAYSRYKQIHTCYIKLWCWGLEGGELELSMECDNWTIEMGEKIGWVQ